MYATKVAKKGYVHSMMHAGFQARLMKARRLEDTERVHVLPPGQPIPIFPIAALPGAPKEWVREAGTYVCPVDVGWGLWFDWTMNDSLNTAVIPSVKGMNPITGRKLEGLQLEQFADKCPKHGKPFAHGRHCEECGYEWPPQNYVCAPNTLWWDGFRQPDGTVRQFFFTDEDKRDIANLVIGKENTVPAFGFAFYRPKTPRTPPPKITRYSGISGQSVGGWDSDYETYDSGSIQVQSLYASNTSADASKSYSSTGLSQKFGGMIRGLDPSYKAKARKAQTAKSVKRSKSVSVGAGAKIHQDLETDSLGLEGWQDKHSAVIRLYFCFEEQFERIVEQGGVKEFKSDDQGYLKDLPVG